MFLYYNSLIFLSAQKVHISESTQRLLGEFGGYVTVLRAEMHIKVRDNIVVNLQLTHSLQTFILSY